MRLSIFILSNLECIFQEWEDFAVTLVPTGQLMGKDALRDHIKPMLEVIAADLNMPESEYEEMEKSKGNSNSPSWEKTAATTHGIERLAWGFSLDAAVAEYRALRASVMRMWKKSLADEPAHDYMIEDVIRFNEAIDQAINESVTSYTFEKAQQMRVFDAILSFMPDISFTLTLEGRLSYVNKAFATLFARPASEVIGKNFVDLGFSNGLELQQHIAQVISMKKQFHGELAYTSASDQSGFYDYILVPALDMEEKVEAVIGTAREVTERKRGEDQNWQRANYDQLTGLPNRRLFFDRLEQELKHAERIGKRTALLFIDLDHFKEVNDAFGHQAGDQLLRLASARLSSCVRETDTLARLGGDEFTIILQDLSDTKYVELVAKEVLHQLAIPFLVFEHTVRISGSIGIALSPQDSKRPEVLMVNADQAMYKTKHAGRNGFSFFSPLPGPTELASPNQRNGTRRLGRH